MKAGNFGPQLLKVLKSKKMSQAALSRKMGYSKTTIYLYTGGKRDPGLDSLLRILIALDITLEDLFKL